MSEVLSSANILDDWRREIESLDLSDKDREALLDLTETDVRILNGCRNFLDFMRLISQIRPRMSMQEMHTRFNCVNRYFNKKSGQVPANERGRVKDTLKS